MVTWCFSSNCQPVDQANCYIRVMTGEKINELLTVGIHAAFKAGDEILEVYNSDFKVNFKSDKSPVTTADQRANAIIEKILETTRIPALTEEGEHLPYSIRKDLDYLWIVDPLDGTKEFVKRNGEFTVNIALTENGNPIIGVIFSPVFKDLYFAARGIGAFKMNKHKVIAFLNTGTEVDSGTMIRESDILPLLNDRKKYTVVASRSHLSAELYKYIDQLKWEKGEIELVNTGSSIKMCLVAEGAADEYPRFGDTMEWDTCAGQCILEQAGGSLLEMESRKPMKYNREILKNPSFLAIRPR